MPIVSFGNLGAVGLAPDAAQSDIAYEGWTEGKHVRFTVRGVETVGGEVYLGSPFSGVQAVFPILVEGYPALTFWARHNAFIKCGDVTRTITKQGGSYDSPEWTGGSFNGIVVASNKNDHPQVWIPGTFLTKAIDMPNWPGYMRCLRMRPWKNFLFALGLIGDGFIPFGVRWSHPADPGNVPASWDIRDPTKDAGEWYLADTEGEVVDLIPMGNDAILYKTDAIYRVQFVGGQFIFKFSKVTGNFGIPYVGAAVAVHNGRHVFWTGDDMILFDGVNFKSIAEGRMRRTLQSKLEGPPPNKLKLHYNDFRRELLVSLLPV